MASSWGGGLARASHRLFIGKPSVRCPVARKAKSALSGFHSPPSRGSPMYKIYVSAFAGLLAMVVTAAAYAIHA
jgi:hypothetical protein